MPDRTAIDDLRAIESLKDETRAWLIENEDDHLVRRLFHAVAAMQGENRRLKEQLADRAEDVTRLYKANDSALSWIRETVAGAKAAGSTIDVIAQDHDRNAPLWGRTERVIRQLRYAAGKARRALQGAKPND